MTDRPNGLTYAQAGVDIDAGNALIERIKPFAKATRRPGADAALGGFGALFDLKAAGYDDPLLVTTTDGTGRATHWRVTGLEVRGKGDLPAFPTTGARRLVLVTCGGPVVDTPSGRRYRDNVVVTAVPAAP